MTGPKGRRDVIAGLKAKGASVAYGSANADFLYSSGDAPITLYGKSDGDILIGGAGKLDWMRLTMALTEQKQSISKALKPSNSI